MVDLLNRWDMVVAKIKKHKCVLLDKWGRIHSGIDYKEEK